MWLTTYRGAGHSFERTPTAQHPKWLFCSDSSSPREHVTHPMPPRMVSRGRTTDEQAPTWRERLEALRHVPPLIRMIWRTHRGYTAEEARDGARFWKPLIFAPEQLNRGQHWLHAIGRLRSGANIGAADNSRVPDGDASDVGNCIEGARRQHADNHSKFSRTWPRRILHKRRHQR